MSSLIQMVMLTSKMVMLTPINFSLQMKELVHLQMHCSIENFEGKLNKVVYRVGTKHFEDISSSLNVFLPDKKGKTSK